MRRKTTWVASAVIALAALSSLVPKALAACTGAPAPYNVTLAGAGTAESPYLVDTPLKLSAVSSGTCAGDATYALAADLQMPTATTTGTVTSNFRRLGSLVASRFTGTFDGAGYTIRDLTYRDTVGTADGNEIGLFSNLGDGAVVRNLDLEDVDILGTSAVGAVVGTVEPYVQPVLIEGVVVTGNVRGQYEVGGIVGLISAGGSTATVRDALTFADVASTATGTTYVGGAVGRLAATGDGSVRIGSINALGVVTAAGDVVGGAIGDVSALFITGTGRDVVVVEDTVAYGSVVANQYAGGLIGRVTSGGSTVASSQVVIERSAGRGPVTAGDAVGGLVSNVTANASGAPIRIRDAYASSRLTRAAGGAGTAFGGLIGFVDGSTAVTIVRTYARGFIDNGGNGGGIVGTSLNAQASATSALWDTQAMDVSTSEPAGAIGRTTAELRDRTTYANQGWGIVPFWQDPAAGAAWGICASVNNGYPFLLSEYSTTPCLPPARPTGLSATAGVQAATIAFTPGDAGEAPIAGYEASVDGGTWVAASGTGSPVTVSGLTAGRENSIRLRAVSAVGPGEASDVVAVTPLAPAAAPSPPPSPTATAVRVGRTTALPGGRARVAVTVTGPGRIVVTGTAARGAKAAKPACRATRTVTRAGTYTMVCRVDRATRTRLNRGPVRLQLRIAFIPTTGAATTATSTVTLPRASRR